MIPESVDDSADTRGNRLRCLWLTRLDPRSPDAGDLTYSFHLLTSLSRTGVRLTVLAGVRTPARPRSVTEEGGWIGFSPLRRIMQRCAGAWQCEGCLPTSRMLQLALKHMRWNAN